MSDQMDLLVEQVKMLAGEIAFSTSTLKRMVEQSVNEPDSSKTQVYRSYLLYHQTNVVWSVCCLSPLAFWDKSFFICMIQRNYCT